MLQQAKEIYETHFLTDEDVEMMKQVYTIWTMYLNVNKRYRESIQVLQQAIQVHGNHTEKRQLLEVELISTFIEAKKYISAKRLLNKVKQYNIAAEEGRLVQFGVVLDNIEAKSDTFSKIYQDALQGKKDWQLCDQQVKAEISQNCTEATFSDLFEVVESVLVHNFAASQKMLTSCEDLFASLPDVPMLLSYVSYHLCRLFK